MPTYTLEDKETGQQEEVFMTWDELQEYKKLNPHLKQVIGAPNIISGARVGTGKLGGFKEVLQKVGEGHPGSYVDKAHNRRTAKQVATDKVAVKHGIKKDV
tara:strand:+ start:121 stop:423 length:303 start_codon:yes stop_codon:yes gene_type:complete